MRPTPRTALTLLFLVPALALGQDAPAPVPTGTVLLEAAPEKADLLLHTPDFHGLLASGSKAGLGSPAAWKDALSKQAAAWADNPEHAEALSAAVLQLLRMADGEALLAGLSVPTPGGFRRRAFVLAFRTSARKNSLTKSLMTVVEAGLRGRYLGDLTDESILGREVRSLGGTHSRLYLHASDGLLVVADDALAMGVLFQGIERVVGGGNLGGPAGQQLLEVRHGPASSRWTGWMFGPRESVSWPDDEEARGAAAPLSISSDNLAPGLVLAVSLTPVRDVPILPQPLPDWISDSADRLGELSPGGVGVILREDGGFGVSGVAPDGVGETEIAKRLAGALEHGALHVNGRFWGIGWAPQGEPVPGGSRQAAWLGAMATGGLPSALPGIDRTLLKDPLGSVPRKPEGELFSAWKAGDREGELRGPAWHGPATGLALRTLRHIALGLPPGATAPPTAAPPPPTGAPLPAPTEPRARKRESDDE